MDELDPVLEQRLERIAAHPFRANFHLRGRDRATAILRGLSAIRRPLREA